VFDYIYSLLKEEINAYRTTSIYAMFGVDADEDEMGSQNILQRERISHPSCSSCKLYALLCSVVTRPYVLLGLHSYPAAAPAGSSARHTAAIVVVVVAAGYGRQRGERGGRRGPPDDGAAPEHPPPLVERVLRLRQVAGAAHRRRRVQKVRERPRPAGEEAGQAPPARHDAHAYVDAAAAAEPNRNRWIGAHAYAWVGGSRGTRRARGVLT
jgi:hypothetical protein